MSQLKFSPFDKICYDRAKETFPKEKGTCSEDTEQFILSITEVKESSDIPTLQNAINFARSWAELGFILPQKVMNKILRAAFKEKIIVPQLSLLASFFSNNNWLFNAIMKLMKTQPKVFIESIEKNNPVWGFILKAFDADFYEKSVMLDTNYYERPISFLSEVLLFRWPQKPTDEISLMSIPQVSISENAKMIIDFCVNLKGEAANGIINSIAPLFPNETLSSISGHADRLTGNNLAYFVSLGFKKKDGLKGDDLTIALKILPRNPKLADSLARNLDDAQKKTYQEMKNHFNTTTKHFSFS